MKEKDKKAAPAKKAKAAAPKTGKAKRGAITDGIYAAISMALYQETYEAHDAEPMRLTIKRHRHSAWSLKTLMLRQLPK
ncbi:hypothetical protein HR17_00170 [Porphyromonas gulae]|uniref:Uncharacterized protein n=1 Tax=Porphyromonas gulae TaxID=111105 RepID=A0A099WR95_9PORP|nr:MULTISPECIES: hypothetical protein [Porphyromonas]KGL47156.1 hypothetical protein HQ49_09780 [Porphyromonas gulae]KGL54092.1 hypothetical protein HQ50_10505 [Porphyromonas sp. COT-052 OH4946]KGN67109.1 hypothetical protein HR09_10660 [Porphyromonas gulae]KGN74797.1 hypothetical protein HQ40_07345 [Porphyromonas gulae]KGN77349.1 hypothetical protein HR17_00170 [Porphyromonas gulae]